MKISMPDFSFQKKNFLENVQLFYIKRARWSKRQSIFIEFKNKVRVVIPETHKFQNTTRYLTGLRSTFYNLCSSK